jgi:hypothetical protein
MPGPLFPEPHRSALLHAQTGHSPRKWDRGPHGADLIFVVNDPDRVVGRE